MDKRYSLDEIWQAYCDHEKPDARFLEDLIWHIDHDKDAWNAMHMAADLARQETIPAIARHLKHDDHSVREGAATTLCRLLAYGHPDIDMYAAKLYHAAKYDDVGNRGLITSFMESILDVTGSEMRTQIAELIHSYTRLSLTMNFAYQAMLNSIDEPYNDLDLPMYPDFMDVEKVHKFRVKYNI